MKLMIEHIRPNGMRDGVATVETTNEMRVIVDSPRYMGTWIGTDRKLLRYGLGEIRIYNINVPAVIYNFIAPTEPKHDLLEPIITIADILEQHTEDELEPTEPAADVWEDATPEVTISSKQTVNEDRLIYRLVVENHSEIGWVDITDVSITVYDKNVGEALCVANDFSTVVARFDKEVAYLCMVSYDEFIEVNNLEGAL